MNLVEAVAAFEKDFSVVSEAGLVDPALVERRDMSKTPEGQPYVVVTSGGVKGEAVAVPAWFAGEDLAAEAWLREAWAYADRQGGGTLFWRDKPEYTEAEFVAVSQAALMNDPHMRASITLRIGWVRSRLFVSKGDAGKAKA